MPNMFKSTLASGGGNGADLIVTCAPNFAGSVITCTDGSAYTKAKTCPSSSPYEVTFESIPPGTYTISGVVSGQTFSTTKTILDFDASLNDIPEGATVTPTDDIQIWLHCSNIWDKNYTTISQVLADASTLQALIASNNSADYMARSTTWASDVAADSSAMSYIGLNDYCSDVLLSDSTWCAAICNSLYFESVLNIKVPTMTSDTTPSGQVIYVNQNANYPKWHAFNGNNSSWAIVTSAVSDKAVGYKFTEPINIRKVYHYSSNQNYKGFDANAILQYSDDGTTWSGSASIPGATDNTAHNNVVFDNLGKHLYWRALDNRDWSLSTLQFYGRA